MPIAVRFLNFDRLYEKQKTHKVLINEIDVFDEENLEILDRMMYLDYSGDSISLLPSCQCGDIKGVTHLGAFCNKCNTHVEHQVDGDISYLLWCRQPEGVAPFINPAFMYILGNRFRRSKSKFCLTRWLLLPKTYRVQPKMLSGGWGPNYERIMEMFKERNLKRGYNFFVENMETMLTFLLDCERFIKSSTRRKPGEIDPILQSFHQYKDDILSGYLPFHNKILAVTESGELGRYHDSLTNQSLDSVRRLAGIDIYNRTDAQKQERVAVALLQLSEFYADYVKNRFTPREGLFRKHVLGTRNHFSARCVISSLNTIHAYDEIHIPWSVAVELFRYHLVGRLLNEGRRYREVERILSESACEFNPHLYNHLCEIIASAGKPYDIEGFPCLFNRNPGLKRGSVQFMRITHIKKNTEDKTFSFSILAVKQFNADFDGDEMNLQLALVDEVVHAAKRMQAHRTLLSPSHENDFEFSMEFPPPVVLSIANWFNEEV